MKSFRGRVFNDKNIALMRTMAQEGKSARQIAERIGSTTGTVRALASRLGILSKWHKKDKASEDSVPSSLASPTVPTQKQRERLFQEARTPVVAELKARQLSKIREIRDALVSAGFLTLDEQAKALGLPRSTAWTIIKASHKGSGLSASSINRMLGAPQLPLLVRAKILEYVKKKTSGLYGDNKLRIGRFAARLSDHARVGVCPNHIHDMEEIP